MNSSMTFLLFSQTTFLNACIMHGYFTLVRTQALKTINRAHSVVRKPTPFPLSQVANMLAFPDARKVSFLFKVTTVSVWV